MTCSRFARTVICRLARAVERELPAVRQGRGVEPVHRARVSCRRLQTNLWLFKDVLPKISRRFYRSQIKSLLTNLGQARDLDVQISFFSLWLREKRMGKNVGLREYVFQLKARRKRIQPCLSQTADKVMGQQWLQELLTGNWETRVTSPGQAGGAPETLRMRIRKLVNEVRRYEQDIGDPEKVKQLHALRIAAKHLRYALEVFVPIGGADFKNRAAEILVLHHLLGDLHDYHVWASGIVQEQRSLTDKSGLEPVRARLIRLYQKTHQQFVSAWARAARQGLWEKLESLSFDFFS